jgi:histidinol-phosphatase (PHP family)
MLANYHTHTTYCDGQSTAEDIVLSAIEKGFGAIGFSGHGYTKFDGTYCMKDTDAYINEIAELKKKYSDKIQIYCGVEEDAFHPVDRTQFDYIIGSSHYLHPEDGKYCPIDLDYDGFCKCIEFYGGDVLALAEAYYSSFVSYLMKRKPDIVGHFDLITKYDEKEKQEFLNNEEYLKISEKYMQKALECDCIFEVNTGAISRGLRTTPYPAENLLFVLLKNGGKIILSADSHHKDTIDCNFKETEKMLADIGFDCVYELDGGIFKKRPLL